MKLLPVIALALLATGCASNKPPMPTGNSIRINTTDAVESLMYDSGFVLIGPERDREHVRKHFLHKPERLLSREPDPDTMTRLGADLVKRVIVVPFDYASADFKPESDTRFYLRQLLAIADRIEIRGRTDGPADNYTNARMAYRRADAARRYLLERDVPGSIIAVNVVGAGDHVADNESEAGRGKNRRVEIEFFIDKDWSHNEGVTS